MEPEEQQDDAPKERAPGEGGAPEEASAPGEGAPVHSTPSGGSRSSRGGRGRGRAQIALFSPEEGEQTLPLQRFTLPKADEARGNTPPRWPTSLAENDRSLPRPVAFAWQDLTASAAIPGPLSDSEEAALRYDLELFAEDSSREEQRLRGLLGPQASVVNLRVGTPYRWRVRARLGKRVIAGSGWGRFTTHPAAPRWIHAPGITNVRDLGGWPLPDGHRVRQGLLFRGSEMNSHCAITEAGRAVLMRELAIRTDLDLRGAGEERQAVLDPARVAYVNIPLASYDMIASPEYIKHYRDVFQLLATRARYPIFMHCWGGADRAGTVAFLVGALLGMRQEDLIQDYELTSLSIWGERSSHSEVFQELLQTLEVFARKGSSLQTQVERYLHVIEVSQQEIAAIRDILTER